MLMIKRLASSAIRSEIASLIELVPLTASTRDSVAWWKKRANLATTTILVFVILQKKTKIIVLDKGKSWLKVLERHV